MLSYTIYNPELKNKSETKNIEIDWSVSIAGNIFFKPNSSVKKAYI